MGAAGVNRRNNQPALVSSVVVKNLRFRNETGGHDFAIHHWDNGMGQLHLLHDGFSNNRIPLSNKHKRSDGKGFKIVFHKVASNILDSSFVETASVELSVNWSAFAHSIPAMFALTFFGVLHVPINVPALAISTGEDTVSPSTAELLSG